MPSAEERQARALETIAHYMKQLVPIFETINNNLVDFAKIVAPQKVELRRDIEAAKEAATHTDTVQARYVPAEGYAAGAVEIPKVGE